MWASVLPTWAPTAQRKCHLLSHRDEIPNFQESCTFLSFFFFFARPAPLRAPARPTQPLEPILIPKLRIRLADFPYLHCSNMPEAVHLGDLLRIWVRPGARFTPSPPDFQGPARAHRTPPEPRRFPRHGPLSRGEPIPGRPALHKEKRTLPGAPAGFSGIGCVTALDASQRPSPPLRIRGSEPDSLSIG